MTTTTTVEVEVTTDPGSGMASGVAARPLGPRPVIGATSAVDHALATQLARAADLPFNYAEIGASLTGPPPSGYTPITADAVVGAGRACFDVIAGAIRSWQIQIRSGLRVKASGPAYVDADVALARLMGPIGIVLACRVVRIFDEPRRSGFAYGTLQGHPEAGEEAFFVELADDDAVTFRVRGFTKPGTLATAIFAPVATILERQAVLAYLKAAHALASRSGSPSADDRPR